MKSLPAVALLAGLGNSGFQPGSNRRQPAIPFRARLPFGTAPELTDFVRRTTDRHPLRCSCSTPVIAIRRLPRPASRFCENAKITSKQGRTIFFFCDSRILKAISCRSLQKPVGARLHGQRSETLRSYWFIHEFFKPHRFFDLHFVRRTISFFSSNDGSPSFVALLWAFPP